MRNELKPLKPELKFSLQDDYVVRLQQMFHVEI